MHPLPKPQLVMLVVLALALATSLVQPPFPRDMLLQHLPTVLLIIALPFALRRYPLSNASVACIIGFLLLHVLGARWVYTFVPYDRVAEALFGTSVSGLFSWERNHYDRLVHIAYGALAIRPFSEFLARHWGLSKRRAAGIALAFVLAPSLLYEVFEWGLTLVVASERALRYNGQQGDVWDAQKDMACALAGALLALSPLLWRGRHMREAT